MVLTPTELGALADQPFYRRLLAEARALARREGCNGLPSGKPMPLSA